MEIEFYKYQGTGNDFIMMDDREGRIELSKLQIAKLCDRRLGIGADGIILIRDHPELDFHMLYYNADGSQSFCGNGSRCSIAFARKLNMISNHTRFMAVDGLHEGKIEGNLYATHMKDVSKIELKGKDFFMDTGSPHYIKWVENVDKINVVLEGKLIRNSAEYKVQGTNVNFAHHSKDNLCIRTYERGVEDETLSCGTGVTAVALAANYLNQQKGKQEQRVITRGGELKIRFNSKNDGSYDDIWLVGPAEMVFKGKIETEVRSGKL